MLEENDKLKNCQYNLTKTMLVKIRPIHMEKTH